MPYGRVEAIRDMLYPGLRAWQGKGVPEGSLVVQEEAVVFATEAGVEHVVAGPGEIADGSYKKWFNPRMRLLLPAEKKR